MGGNGGAAGPPGAIPEATSITCSAAIFLLANSTASSASSHAAMNSCHLCFNFSSALPCRPPDFSTTSAAAATSSSYSLLIASMVPSMTQNFVGSARWRPARNLSGRVVNLRSRWSGNEQWQLNRELTINLMVEVMKPLWLIASPADCLARDVCLLVKSLLSSNEHSR